MINEAHSSDVIANHFLKKDCKQQYKIVQMYILISLKQIHDFKFLNS